MQRYFVYVTKDPGDSDKVLFGGGQWPEDTDAVRDAGHTVDPVEKIASVTSSKGMVLTLCNLNPIRGTSLFAVQNGSSIYDWILENQNNILNGKEIRKSVKRTRTLVSLDLLRRTGPRIEEMLKLCRSDRYIYGAGNFSTILTHYGICYFVEVEADVRNIHCVLDPQEYDYLINGYNAVGFRIWLHFTKKQAITDLKIDDHSTYVDLHAADAQIEGIRPNEVIVGSDYDTVIRVVGNLRAREKCQAITYPSCSLSCLGTENDVTEQDNVYKNQGTFKWQPENLHSGKNPNLPETSCLPYVLSALQFPKSSVYQKLLALKYPTMFQRNALTVSMGLRIQQRAYLRLANATAFEELRALVDAFGDLQKGLENISTQVYTIRRRLWSDEVKFSQRRETGEKSCVSDVPQHLRTLLNITESFNEEICNLLFSDAFFGSYALSCVDKPWPADYSTNSFTKHQTNTTTDYVLDSSLDYLIKEDMDRRSRLELQILDMFFKNISPQPVLKELLRRHLRSLSAIRMQLRPGKVAGHSSIAPLDIEHPGGIEMISTTSPTTLCTNELPESMRYAYDNELLELGESVASTLQRLDWFFNHMQEIVKVNQAIIRTLQLSNANLSQVPHPSLVSFKVQVERDASMMVAHSLSSLDNLLSSFSEVLTTFLTTVGLLVSILLLAERRFIGQWKHVNPRGQRSMVQKQTDT
ncbi:unnamed protein product [Dicrocoelium dendriticum]|nr:unnamed protein product [Dicrocoelium dendriticum]